MRSKELDTWLTAANRAPLVMGVLNMTPDSFSDGGAYATPATAAERIRRMIDEGADWIDIGGESTRPGSEPVAPEQQIIRILPAIESATRHDVVISIDTTSAPVAAVALDAGAHVINDVSAGRFDPDLLPLVASRAVPVVLMHMQGTPRDMQSAPQYDDVTTEILTFLQDRISAATTAGVKRHRVVIDPGIGFGKTDEHNLQLLRDLRRFRSLGTPLLVGTSRKGFIGRITNEPRADHRQFGTAATVAWSIAEGADIVRVHDIRAMKQVVSMIGAIRRAGA